VTVALFRRDGGLESPCKWPFQSVICAELQRLSDALNKRADFLKMPHDESYRNLTGLKMMYQNLIFVASNNTCGLPNAGKGMYVVFDMYQKCPEAYKMILEEFSTRYSY
jgi:hypothetical protein